MTKEVNAASVRRSVLSVLGASHTRVVDSGRLQVASFIAKTVGLEKEWRFHRKEEDDDRRSIVRLCSDFDIKIGDTLAGILPIDAAVITPSRIQRILLGGIPIKLGRVLILLMDDAAGTYMSSRTPYLVTSISGAVGDYLLLGISRSMDEIPVAAKTSIYLSPINSAGDHNEPEIFWMTSLKAALLQSQEQ